MSLSISKIRVPHPAGDDPRSPVILFLRDRFGIARLRQQSLHFLARQSAEDGNPGCRLLFARDPELSVRDFHIDQLGKFGERSMGNIVPQKDFHQRMQKTEGGSGQRLQVLGLSHVGNIVPLFHQKQCVYEVEVADFIPGETVERRKRGNSRGQNLRQAYGTCPYAKSLARLAPGLLSATKSDDHM
jgi:hypothetical protein